MQQNNDEGKFEERVINGVSYYWHPELGWLAKSFEEFAKAHPIIGCDKEIVNTTNAEHNRRDASKKK